MKLINNENLVHTGKMNYNLISITRNFTRTLSLATKQKQNKKKKFRISWTLDQVEHENK